MNPSPASRFGGFAAGHFVVTALCASLLFFVPQLLVGVPLPLRAMLMMALYVPAGWVVAALRRWARPTLKDGVKAVLYPALMAWVWAFGGWLLFCIPLFNGLGFLMLISTYFLACPSFTLMLCGLDGLLDLTTLSASASGWYLLMVPAGLLPPLLFFLGSILPKKRLTTAQNMIE